MTKPFNLADAKLGHPIAITYQGGSNPRARIITADLANQWPVVVAYRRSNTEPLESLCRFDEHGANPQGEQNWTGVRATLVMAPLGTVDGREVYPGDMLSHCGGEAVPVPYGVPFDPGMWSWPVAAYNYPVTQMSGRELAGSTIVTGNIDVYVAVANAAIKHGIDEGYLYDAARIDPLFNKLYPTVAIYSEVLTFEQAIDCAVAAIKERNALLEMNAEQARTIVTLRADAARGDDQRMHYANKAEEYANALAEILKEVGVRAIVTSYTAIPQVVSDRMAEMRLREVAVASHFYDKGTSNEFSRVSINCTRMEYITTELAKVK